MQKEIELLMMAIHQEQRREQELLDSVLASIAACGTARKAMATEIAQAIAESSNKEAEDTKRRQQLANDIENVIVSLRRRAA